MTNPTLAELARRDRELDIERYNRLLYRTAMAGRTVNDVSADFLPFLKLLDLSPTGVEDDLSIMVELLENFDESRITSAKEALDAAQRAYEEAKRVASKAKKDAETARAAASQASNKYNAVVDARTRAHNMRKDHAGLCAFIDREREASLPQPAGD